MSLSLDDLGRAAYESQHKNIDGTPHGGYYEIPGFARRGLQGMALAVAETLLNYLSELADDEPLDGHELRAVLAELKGEMK